jgi:beta-N-acetylhexosaminidase
VVKRRRRLVAAAAVVIVLAIVVIAVASAGSGRKPHFSLGAVSVATGSAAPATPPVRAAPFRPSPAAVTLAGRMSLADQVAQLFMVGVQGEGSDALASIGVPDVGGVVLTSANFSSDAQVKALVTDVTNAAHSAGAQPPLIAATQEGGPQTAFADLPPQSEPVIGATGQPAVAQSQALLAGRRLRAVGVEMTLAPLADVDTLSGALSGRLFGTDPKMVAQFALAAVSGYHAAGVISAVGHFPGAGAASADPDEMSATVGLTMAQLEARDLVPFAAVARTAPVVVMSNAAYVAFDGVTPAGLLEQAVSLLRDQYGFGGVVMTDDLDATLDPTGSTPADVALQALRAGDDLLYISGPPSEHVAAYDGVLAAAQQSPSVRALVRAALLRDETLKAGYGVRLLSGRA